MKLNNRFLMPLLIFGFSHQALAVDAFYADKARGWFWREEQPEIEVPRRPIEPSKPVESPKEEIVKQKPGSHLFSVEWFQANYKKLQAQAIDNPTPENVTAMLAAERMMRDKATAVSTVAQDVIKATPWLDENARTPSSTFGENAGKAAAEEGVKRWAKAVASQTAIWFFFKSDCPYCKAQVPALQFLSKAYGYRVIAISMDGGNLPGIDPSWSVKRDSGQSQKLGVSVTPTLYLARPPGDLVPLAYGLTPALEIAGRSVDVAASQNWINPQAKQDIRITKSELHPGSSKQGETPQNVSFEDTKQIIDYVKNVLRGR